MNRLLQYLLTGTYTDRSPIAQSRLEEFAHIFWLMSVMIGAFILFLVFVA